MKQVTITIVLLLCILIIAGGCHSDMSRSKYKKLQLQSFSIETGGGMNGGQSTLRVQSDTERNIVTVYKSVTDVWYLNARAELYVVDRTLLDEIKQIVIDEKLYHAPKAPLSDMQVLDEATTSFHALFSEGEYFSYSSNQELSSQVYDANEKIRAVIEEYCDHAEAYPTVYAEAEGDDPFQQEREGIAIDCSNEAPFQMNLNIHNGTDDAAKLTGHVTISSMDGDEAVLTDTLIEDYSVEVSAGGRESIRITLPFDRYPTEGTYKMAYAGYETTFEMKIYQTE